MRERQKKFDSVSLKINDISKDIKVRLKSDSYNVVDIGLFNEEDIFEILPNDRKERTVIYKDLHHINGLNESAYISGNQVQALLEQPIQELLREIKFTESKDVLFQDLQGLGELAEKGLFSKEQHQVLVNTIVDKIKAL